MARRWLVAVLAVPVVVAVAGVVAALSFDPASQKDRIVQAVYRATGRTLALAGPVRISWGLVPALEAEDVSLANMAGGSRPQMLTVARVEARLELLALLSRRVEIASVTLVRPDILLETDANGRGNWQFDRPAAAPAGETGPSASGPRNTVRLDRLTVQDGRLTWRDGVAGRDVVADIPAATLDLSAGPAHVLAQGQLEPRTAGTDMRLEATLGTWEQMTGQSGPFPVKLAASAGEVTVALDGTADPTARSVTGRVEAAVPDLARLGMLVGRPGLPPLRDLHLAATLPPPGQWPQDIALQAGASDLGAVVPGAALARLSFTWPAGQAARLEAAGTVAGGPWQIATGLLPAGQGVALRGLSITSPYADGAGDMAFTLSPRRTLKGTLVASRIDADAIAAAARPAAPAPVASAPAGLAAPAPASAPTPVFSAAPLPWGLLRDADADMQLNAATVRLGGADYHGVAAKLLLQGGLLRLNPASATSPAGRVDLSASADAAGETPAVALVARSAALSLDPVLQAAGLPGGSDAASEVDVALHATGTSPHALAASLTGHVGLALVDGDIANAALSALLGDALRQVPAGLDPGGRSHIRCLALRADAAEGVVTLSAFKLDTSRLELEGGGTVNLADETLALRLRPLLRVGGAGVAAPLRVDGALRRPAVMLDGPAGGRTSLTIGGLAGPADSCTAELAAARDGRSGRLPAEVAAGKPAKPADLLRSFLR